MAGIFITLEGPDGAGKSTQARMLASYLQSRGKEVFLTREPGGTLIAEKIRSILLEETDEELAPLTEVLLYAASRAQHVARLIKPALARGAVVISDRFVDSSIAYQGYGRGLDPELIWALNRPGLDGLLPHLTIILDVEPGVSKLRLDERNWRDGLDPDRLELEKRDFHSRVRRGFLEMAAKEPERLHLVPAAGTVEEVHQAVLEIVKRKFGFC
ncbi:MAG: dTMP kinase [Clostridia bacterium]|nr:dTMP kinase [Clostridia bacterium]